MTLRADPAQSNYLGCLNCRDILPNLEHFSFFVFLNICPLEFDKFQCGFCILSCLRFGYSQIDQVMDIHVSFLESRLTHVGEHFENFHEKMTFPKSIQDQSGMVAGSPGHQKTSI